MSTNESFGKLICAEQILMAEDELSAFFTAVKQSFGEDQARLSAEDWLDESRRIDHPKRTTGREWRAVTIAASARMAKRLAASSHSPRSVTTIDKKVSPIPSCN